MVKKSFIFEEVNTASNQKVEAGIINRSGKSNNKSFLLFWLYSLLFLVTLMIIIGGLTRLTDSGLSITEWKPISGILLPFSEIAWQQEFLKYQEIPEYKLQNLGMSIGEFKVIYYWEWGHRQLGRIIGLVWFFGFGALLLTKKTTISWTKRALLVGILIGFQGFLGWWMVSSGLNGAMLDVASYRLGIHLTSAFIIFGLIFWYILRLRRTEVSLIQSQRYANTSSIKITITFLVLLYIQIFLGALVAGIDAGQTYTDWPLMAGEFFPTLAFELNPLWRNFFESEALVQFNHRLSGYILILFALYSWFKFRNSSNQSLKSYSNWVLLAILGQVVLGVITVLYAAVWYIAILHQFSAIILVSLVLLLKFEANYPATQFTKTS
ncbi:MAG: COX15/CtaA family protein [Paracoccaceae bacterium]